MNLPFVHLRMQVAVIWLFIAFFWCDYIISYNHLIVNTFYMIFRKFSKTVWKSARIIYFSLKRYPPACRIQKLRCPDERFPELFCFRQVFQQQYDPLLCFHGTEVVHAARHFLNTGGLQTFALHNHTQAELDRLIPDSREGSFTLTERKTFSVTRAVL